MSEKPISPLRQRMIEDMSVRNFGEKTRNDYIRHVRTFTAFLGRSPDTATAEDLRRFQLHQSKTGVRPPTINGSVAALRFFFTVTLGRANVARHLTLVREPRKMPLVLSLDEIARLLEAAPGPKVQGRTERGLRRRTAGLRGGGTQGVRRRFQANAAADRTGQGAEGSLCDALASAARSLTRLVSHCAAGSVVVPWPRSAAAVNDAPVQPRRSRRRRDGRDQEAG